MNITTLIMIFILLAVFVVMVIISRNKALKAQSNNANADENNEGDDASVNPKAVPNVKYYKIEDPELAHVFSVRANRVLGISEIIHSFFIFAFLFFPIDILRIDTLFEALTDFFSDPLDEILKPAPFLAIIFVFWGCFNLFSGVYSLIKSNSPDFTFSAFDYAAFASKCTDSGASRVLFCISSSVLCFSFWLYALLMLNVNLLDAWVPMLTLLAYIFIYKFITLNVRRSVFEQGKSYGIKQCKPTMSDAPCRPSRLALWMAFICIVILYTVLAKFVF